jgi:hypothetical protein
MTSCTRHRLFCLLALLSATLWPVGASAQIHREGLVRTLTPAITPTGLRDRGDGVLWQTRIEQPGSEWMRLQFARITVTPGVHFQLVLRDRTERQIARYTDSQFALNPEFLTPVLFSSGVTVQLEALEGQPVRDGSLMFELTRVIYQVDATGRFTPQSLVPDWRTVSEAVAITKRADLPQLARSVAKLYIGDGFVCTGFLIGTDTLLTNNHCLAESTAFGRTNGPPSARGCSDIEIQFDFDQQPEPARSVRTNCRGVRDFDPKLDFAVLAFNPDAVLIDGKQRRVPLRIRRDAGRYVGQSFVVHHPAGLAKKVSFACATYSPTDPARVDHDCATVGGSSGSPVFSEAGEVVALHFAGPYPDEWTMADIQRALQRGDVFRNKAMAIAALLPRLNPFMPATPPPPPPGTPTTSAPRAPSSLRIPTQ